jgi:hypothetical protein
MKTRLTYLILPVLALVCAILGTSTAQNSKPSTDEPTGTLETLIVASGNVWINLDLGRLNGSGNSAKTETLRFQAAQDSFLPIVVLNNELRGAKPGTMALVPASSAALPTALKDSFNQLVL